MAQAPLTAPIPSPLPVPRARQAYGLPQHPSDPIVLQPLPRQIRFLHPGYPNEHCLLLVLPALDVPEGVHHGLALDVCAMVADNRWDGYFTLDRAGLRRIPTDDLELSLRAEAYYFHVPGDNGDEKDSRVGHHRLMRAQATR
jgi:hypothetical protein